MRRVARSGLAITLRLIRGGDPEYRNLRASIAVSLLFVVVVWSAWATWRLVLVS